MILQLCLFFRKTVGLRKPLSEDGIVGGNELLPSRRLTEGESIIISTNLLEMGLGGVKASWDTENNDKVKNNLQLEPNIVFNRNNSNYELDNTTYLPDINRDLTKTELNGNMKNYIKNMIMEDGGALISVYFSAGNVVRNTNGSDDVLINDLNYVSYQYGNHAVHLIGWDDNYHYEFCYSDSQKYVTSVAYRDGVEYCPTGGDSQGNHYPTVKKQGTGAWIFKNSWGDDYSYVYMPYTSVIDTVIGFDDYSKK